jgi:membrane protease YdiL (CAAX protease family)
MPSWLEQMLKGMTSGKFWMNFLCVSIFAPFFEEWLCRGMVLRGLLAHGSKPWVAIVLSALFFALPHIISQGPAQFFYTFVLGLSFGFVAARTKKVWPCMILHSLSNLYCGILTAVWPMDKPVFLLAYAAIYVFAVPITAIVLLVTNRRKLGLSTR